MPGGEQASMQVRVSWAVASGSPFLFSSQSPAVSCWLSSDTQGWWLLVMSELLRDDRNATLCGGWGVGVHWPCLPVIGVSGQTPLLSLRISPLLVTGQAGGHP